MKNCFSCEGGLSPLTGGDSENNTRSPVAVQIGLGGACIGSRKRLRNQYFHRGEVLLAAAQEQVLAVQQLGFGNDGLRI